MIVAISVYSFKDNDTKKVKEMKIRRINEWHLLSFMQKDAA